MATQRKEPDVLDVKTRAFVERMGSMMYETGIPRMPARIFSALLATDSGRLTAAELAEILKVSPAAISGAVRYLTQVRMVGREREAGSRRDVFVLRDDVFYELMAHDSQALSGWQQGLREGLDAVGVDTPAGQRMLETIEFFEFLEGELSEMMERWRAHKQSQRPTG